MATQDFKPSKEIPALAPGKDIAPPGEAQPATDAVAKKLYQDAQPANVQVVGLDGYRAGVGSGFFEESTKDVVTNSHFVINSEELIVVTPDGQRHQAKFKDLDDIKDLARLDVLDLKPEEKHTLSVSNNSPKYGDRVFALGHPGGSDALYISPGKELGEDTPATYMSDLANANGHSLTPEQIIDLYSDGFSTAQKQDISARMKMPMDFIDAPIKQGNSGGPVLDGKTEVVGLASESFGPKTSGMVRLEELHSFLNAHDHKYNFTYENQSTAHVWMRHWASDPAQNIRAAASDTILGGIGLGTIASGRFKGAGISFGLLAANELQQNYYAFTHSASTMAKAEAGMKMLGDSVALAGSVALMVPRVRRVGEIALGIGAAVHTVANFLPSHLILTKTTRVEGPDRPPTPYKD